VTSQKTAAKETSFLEGLRFRGLCFLGGSSSSRGLQFSLSRHPKIKLPEVALTCPSLLYLDILLPILGFHVTSEKTKIKNFKFYLY